MRLPPYPGTTQCVCIPTAKPISSKAAADMRISYGEGSEGLVEGDLLPDPMQQFGAWFEQAAASAIQEPNAMTIATCAPAGEDLGGQPSARMVGVGADAGSCLVLRGLVGW